ncbi:sugar ABC transporter substrate-binding protein (plasmid) [Priestia megaterium]|uniref:ABC transporter substrate-binding protein n=1 Tax=Priestia megaterium TaxID=1404 RepID=UPI002ACDB774|nr:sugar ABC transporter substrate-binding protein [Priestia megaterium]
MKKKGKKLSVLVLTLIIAFSIFITGCSSSNSTSGNSKDTTLRILVWNNNPEGTKSEREIFDQFEKDNPGIRVEMIYAPYDKFNDKFLTMSAGGDQPDLTWIQPSAFGQFVSKGVLMDLSNKKVEKDKFMPNVLKLGQVEGKQYAMIRDSSAFQVGYNKELFDKAGVSYPKDNWKWSDFLEAAKKLTKVEHGKTVQFGIENYYTNELFVQNGGGIISEDGRRVILDSPESIEAIKFGSDLINRYHVQPTSAQSQGLSNMFLSGKAAMKLMGPWDWTDITKNATFKWDVVPMPAGKAGNVSAASYLPIGIGKGTKHPEEAYKLLEFLTVGKGQDLQIDTISAIPVVKRNAEKIVSLRNAPENAKSLSKSLQEGKTVMNAPYIPEYAEIMNKVQPVIDQINLRGGNPKKDLKRISEQIRKEYNLK